MRKPFLTLPFLGFLYLSSCGGVNLNGSKPQLKEIKQHCDLYAGKRIELVLTYLGWGCPSNCGSPPLTRSDSCFSDGKECIYIAGTAGLSPIEDKGKKVKLTAEVIYERGKCYLKVLKAEKLTDRSGKLSHR